MAEREWSAQMRQFYINEEYSTGRIKNKSNFHSSHICGEDSRFTKERKDLEEKD